MAQNNLGGGLESLIPQGNDENLISQPDLAAPAESAQEIQGELIPEAKKEPVSRASEPVLVTPQFQTPPVPSFASHDYFIKPKEWVFFIDIGKIKPNPYQPRKTFEPDSLKELADSIKEYGILEPLVVVRKEFQNDSGAQVNYELIAGERRLEASKLLGLKTVPAIIREVNNLSSFALALIENLQRKDLNPIERARAFARLSEEFRLSQREIAQQLGKSREFIANTLRLLQLPSEIQKAIEQDKISEAHARLLLIIKNPEQQRSLLGEIISRQMSVKEADELLRNLEGSGQVTTTRKIKQPEAEDPAVKTIAHKLEEKLGTKVAVKQKRKGGEILIEFYSPEELEAIIKKIVGDIEL